jgi:hypothetical protein
MAAPGWRVGGCGYGRDEELCNKTEKSLEIADSSPMFCPTQGVLYEHVFVPKSPDIAGSTC